MTIKKEILLVLIVSAFDDIGIHKFTNEFLHILKGFHNDSGILGGKGFKKF